MNLEGKNIGFALTGSFCTFERTIKQIKNLVDKKANVIPIMSWASYSYDTKFGKAQDFRDKIEYITKNKIIHTIQEAEPIGPNKMLDLLIIAPCSRKYYCKISK